MPSSISNYTDCYSIPQFRKGIYLHIISLSHGLSIDSQTLAHAALQFEADLAM